MKKINQHPVLLYSQDFKDICSPLNKLNITYFSHVHIDNTGKFSAASNNPDYHKYYLEKEYYNNDIHMSQFSHHSKFILWDAFECTGATQQMYEDGERFGAKHVFTIIKKSNAGSDFYHFATHLKDKSINQIYLSQYDLLDMFIHHFNDKIGQSKKLFDLYKIKFGIDDYANGFTYNTDINLIQTNDLRSEFLCNLSLQQASSTLEMKRSSRNGNVFLVHKDTRNITTISKQQLKCLSLLIKGHTAKEIASLLYLSPRTVNNYLEILRDKLGCRNGKELITSYQSQLMNIS